MYSDYIAFHHSATIFTLLPLSASVDQHIMKKVTLSVQWV